MNFILLILVVLLPNFSIQRKSIFLPVQTVKNYTGLETLDQNQRSLHKVD